MGSRVFYWLCTYILRAFVFMVARWEVVGKEHLPDRGPVVLVANHLNLSDPPLLAAAVHRRVTFMAKHELMEAPIMGRLARWYGAFPVRRFEADMKAFRHAQEVLRGGGVLGIFPEGTRSPERGLRKGQPGTAVIAMRTGAPIVPVGITGTEVVKAPRIFWRIFTRPHIRIVIGEPFHLPLNGKLTAEQVDAATDEIMRRIAALLPERYRGDYREGVPQRPARTEEPAAASKG